MTVELGGIVPPLITPLDDEDRIDADAMRSELRYHLDAGVSGVVVGGSTGEGNRLTPDELGSLVGIAADEVDGAVPVVAGVIAGHTGAAVDRAERVRDAGADAVMAPPVPGYFGSQHPDHDGLVEYYRAVGAVGLPTVVYDVVELYDVTAALLGRLADAVPELAGVKVSSDLPHFTDALDVVGDRIRVMSGLSIAQYPTYALGAHGGIMGINAMCPRVSVEMWEAVQAGDHERARDLHLATLPLIRRAMGDQADNFPAGEKAAIDALGRTGGGLRDPFHGADGATRDRIATAVAEMRERGADEPAPDAGD